MNATFHVLSLPHTVTSKEYLACAYTQKVLNLCKMLDMLGLNYYHYGNAGATVNNHVTTIPPEVYAEVYGKYDWHRNFFAYDTSDKAYQTYYENTAKAIVDRAGSMNYVLCPWGWGNKPVLDRLPCNNRFIGVESGIGYESIFSNYRVFESYAWMHHVYGLGGIKNICYYDAVIPNYYDVADFTPGPKNDYVLYLGRLIPRKGIGILCDLARRMPKVNFVLAGQGSLDEFNPPPNCVHIGYVDLEHRRNLLAGAKALITPTIYLEPFGGVTVEALLSGTPILTTDVGAFTENNVNGLTGYRFRTLSEAEVGLRDILDGAIDYGYCRDYAVKNFSLERVSRMYQAYFDRLDTIYNGDNGWYAPKSNDPAMTFLDRYTRFRCS